MSRIPLWAILTPGEPARLESHVRDALMSDADEKEPSFEVISGSGRYHAIVGTDLRDVGAELQIAEDLSLQFEEPVYSINRATDPWLVMSFRNGLGEVEDVGPEALAKSLGCPLPGADTTSERSARTPLLTVALLEGVTAEEARRTLEEDHGEPLPAGRYHFKDTPRGLVLSGGIGGMNFADIILSERLPHATVYAVTASPRLDIFFVIRMRGGEGIEQFARPPQDFPPYQIANEVKGENSPERILAALGIPAEWFQNG
ncbi:hypothetical protein [Archangium violaceum]|uniref:hypothetical protein n=1 Tax=Archangium violaceum TaxID=83451 RepID=UPI0036D8B11D